MRARLLAVVTCAAAFTAFAAREARACGCLMRAEPCAVYAAADVVFVGRATEAGPPTAAGGDSGAYTARGRATRFSVEEAFRGVAGDTAETFEQGTSCDFHFRAGERYFVYGTRDPRDGRVYVGTCGGTKELKDAAADLEYARGAVAGRPVPGIVGSVEREARESARSYRFKRPLDDVEVLVSGGGREVRARTDAKGNFRVYGLRPGEYTVSPKTPPALRHIYTEAAARVQVADGRCAVASFTVTSLSNVSGRVLDHEGAPAKTRINLVPLDEQGRETEPAEGAIETYTGADGRYKFDGLAPGSYRLVVNPRGQPASYDPPVRRTYLPGVRDPERATVITLADGAAYEAEDLRLPPPLVAREIEGVVTFPDGTPAPRALLVLEFTEREGAETTNAADGEGRFRLKVFEGFKYLVSAEARSQRADGVWTGRHSRTVEVTVAETNEPVKLVIDRPGFYRPGYARGKQEKPR